MSNTDTLDASADQLATLSQLCDAPSFIWALFSFFCTTARHPPISRGWPRPAGRYDKFRTWTSDLSADEQSALFSGTAKEFYGIQ